MSLYCYLKEERELVPKKSRKYGLIFSFISLLLGLVFLANAFGPILVYEIRSRRFTPNFISPLEVRGDLLAVVDYSQPQTWFPTQVRQFPNPSKITHYTLSIPKLDIEGVVVQVNGKDLMKSLIQYPGTALPGQLGNTVVFGHSVLPQFFNSKDYRTIFSTLPTLEEEDEIFLNFDGVTYRYQVEKMVEVLPEDVSVLEQHYDRERLSLITCVPPGTYLRRLVVRAGLVY